MLVRYTIKAFRSIIKFDILSQNYVTVGISLALQWILVNGSEEYLFSPFTGPRMSPMSLHFKDSVSIDTGLTIAISGISHPIWKWYMQLVAKSGNDIMNQPPNLGNP
ncbi:UNVERIFIED_CONTAM: hypothetical protein NCL1_51842 [Trichonephila clavipes]